MQLNVDNLMHDMFPEDDSGLAFVLRRSRPSRRQYRNELERCQEVCTIRARDQVI